ncbi:MAG: pilus assembly protein [Anaerolineales bacterium]|nr:pilus assembly protein [Anaerolineales bacterium]
MSRQKIETAKLKRQRSKRAQAMVEFMLALPILLAIIYGILEVSRLIFIFASVSNASRQAARYGAGSGEPINDVAYYQDCEGIRDVANRSAILTEFDNINITYDRGLTPEGEQVPILDIDPDPGTDTCPIGDNILRNGDRIIVQVSASYEPILNISTIKPLEVVSANARTFLISVPIFGSAFPTGFAAETSTPTKAPTKTPVENATATVPTPTYNATYAAIRTAFPYTPTNTLPPTLTFTPSITPSPTQIPSATSTAISCTGDYAVTHEPLYFDKNIMGMKIINNTGHTLVTASVYVEWNHDTGGNPSLRLKQVELENQIWTGDLFTPSGFIPAYYPYIPIGESKIEFTFDQDYGFKDGTERIIVTIGTPGCVNYPVDSQK